MSLDKRLLLNKIYKNIKKELRRDDKRWKIL